MCVLSRRWQLLFENFMNFHFYGTDGSNGELRRFTTNESANNDYVDYVNRSLEMQRGAIIDDFSVERPLDSRHSNDIDHWVEFAARAEVKRLRLNFGIGHDTNHYILTPTSFSNGSFLSLTELYLKGVNVAQGFISNLFVNCLSIRRLSVINSDLTSTLRVESNSLKYLEIGYCNNLTQCHISAKKLNQIELFVDRRLIGLDIAAPSLSSATLALCHGGTIPNGISHCFQELLRRFSQVKEAPHVLVSFDVFVQIASTPLGLKLDFVKDMKLTLLHPGPSWYSSSERQPVLQEWPYTLLKAAPLLQKLSIELVHKEYKLTNEDIYVEFVDHYVPEISTRIDDRQHLCLQEVELRGFSGCKSEVELLLQLHRVAVSFGRLTIVLCTPSSLWPEEDISEFLSQCKTIVRCACLLKDQLGGEMKVLIRIE